MWAAPLLACLRLVAFRGYLDSSACNRSCLCADSETMDVVIPCKECPYCPSGSFHRSQNENNIFGWAVDAHGLGVSGESVPAPMMLEHIFSESNVPLYPRVCRMITHNKECALVRVTVERIGNLSSCCRRCTPDRHNRGKAIRFMAMYRWLV